MKKKLISVLLTGVMAASLLAGCAAPAAPAAPAPAAEAAVEEVADTVEEAADVVEEAAGDEGGLISVGFAQVGHESDWRTASTKSAQAVFSEANGYDLSFVDCDNASAAQLEAVRGFIEQGVDYIIIAGI